MKRCTPLKMVLEGILVLVVVLLSVSFFTTRLNYGILEGRVVDEISSDVVRHLNISLGDRTDILFRSKDFHLSGIPPGRYTLRAEAPYYESFSRDIEIHRGINTLDFTMRGLEIPDLDGIICFTTLVSEGIEIEIRFRNTEGRGITDYPAVPLELSGTLYVREGDQDNYSRGRLMFEGSINLFWDAGAHLARNKGLIPWEAIRVDQEIEQFGVLDLVLVTPQGTFEDTISNVELAQKED